MTLNCSLNLYNLRRPIISRTIEIVVHEIATDGLPNMDQLIGRVAFIFDGEVVSGWPLSSEQSSGLDFSYGPLWEGNEDVARRRPFANVTHWLEFPEPLSIIEKNGVAIKMSETPYSIPANVVSKYYQMDPATEDLLFDGAKLREGMVVLIGAPSLREHTSSQVGYIEKQNRSSEENDRIKERNCWVRVNQLKVNSPSGRVQFIAEYYDGTKRKFNFDIDEPWLVKTDSITKEAHEVDSEPRKMCEF